MVGMCNDELCLLNEPSAEMIYAPQTELKIDTDLL